MSKINIRRISYLKLRMFCEAYVCGSYTKTAENLSTSQTVITRAIDDLEEMLGGITLFVKERNTMVPTKHAHNLYEKIQPSLITINDALEITDDNNSISIAATHSACCTIIPIAISMLPSDVKCSLYNTDRENAINLLRRNIVDIAIFPAFEVPSDLYIVEVVNLDAALLVHKDNPLVHKKNITKEDVFAENLIMVDDYKISENYRELFQSIYDKQRIKINNADYEMISRFVARGHGSCLYSDVPIDIKNVVCINLHNVLPQIKHYAITSSSHYTTILSKFIDSLKTVVLDSASFAI